MAIKMELGLFYSKDHVSDESKSNIDIQYSDMVLHKSLTSKAPYFDGFVAGGCHTEDNGR